MLFLFGFGIIGIIILLILMIRRKNRKHKEQVSYLRNRALKAAEISTQVIKKILLKTIENYILAVYNNDNNYIYNCNLSEKLREEVNEEIKRHVELGIINNVISLSIEKHMPIKQNNISVYTVEDLTAVVIYNIEYTSSHATFNEHKKQRIRQEFKFKTTNNGGWILSEVGKEIFLK